jgi:hypothetical protein
MPSQLTVDDLVVPDLAEWWRVHVDRHRSTLMVDAVDPRVRRGERLAGRILVDATRPSDDERFTAHDTLEDVDADARGSVVVEAGVAGLPPQVEPGLGVLAAPEELERTLPAALEAGEVNELCR